MKTKNPPRNGTFSVPFLGLIGARAWAKLRADTFILTGESITRPASRTVIIYHL
jgi:hypothetical protein